MSHANEAKVPRTHITFVCVLFTMHVFCFSRSFTADLWSQQAHDVVITRTDVDATWRHNDVSTTSFRRHVPAGMKLQLPSATLIPHFPAQGILVTDFQVVRSENLNGHASPMGVELATPCMKGITLSTRPGGPQTQTNSEDSVQTNMHRLACSPRLYMYSRLSLSRSRRDPLKHFEISVLRHIRFAELRKIPMEQPNFTTEHVMCPFS